MSIRIVVSVLTLLLPVAVRGAVMPSDVVNVDFNTSDHGPNSGPSVTYSGLAAGPATAGTSWNGVILGPKTPSGGNPTYHAFGPTSPLLASDGTTATTVTVSLSNILQYNTDENPAAAPNGNLLNDYAYGAAGANNVSMTISGLSGAAYNLYIYSENGNYKSENSTFTISGGGPSATANNALAPSSSTFTLNGNYVVFTNLTPSSGSLTVNMTAAANGAIDGFQLVQVPEPGSMILIMLLAGGVISRRIV